jgi:hypothetical protein
MKKLLLICVLVWSLLGALPVCAQSTVSDVLNFLVTNQSIPTGSVERDRAAAQATSDTIARMLRTNLATLPVSTSSGGFVYRLDPNLGTMERQSASFGPIFVERSAGAGRGAASVGLTIQHMRFDSLDGRDLRNGSLVTTANQFADETQPFDVDRLTLAIDADVATLHANLGLSDDTEFGAALPLVALRVDGTRLNTYRGRSFTQARASATAIGVADLLLHFKQTAFRGEGAALAAAADVRLPTGRERDLLGAGSTSVRISAIGSMERRRLSADANVGLTMGGLAREWNYSGALAAAVTARMTWTAEIVGRWIDSPGAIGEVALPHPTLVGVRTIRLLPGSTGTRMTFFSPGLKVNVSDTWVLVANVMVPLTKGGLTAPFTPLVGFDYGLQ